MAGREGGLAVTDTVQPVEVAAPWEVNLDRSSSMWSCYQARFVEAS